MDITSLSLPIRRDRPSNNLFGVSSSLSSVNVSYETAEGQYGHSPNSKHLPLHSDSLSDNNESSKESSDDSSSDSSKLRSTPPSEEREFPSKSLNVSMSDLSLHENESAAGNGTLSDVRGSSSPESQKPFPKVNSTPSANLVHNSDDHTRNLASARSSRRRARKRSSISIASAECQNFVQSLKEPKYAKPLSADEISWIFQDFYRKSRQDVSGSEDELLSAEEMEDRKNLESDIESILDRAEKAVTCGDSHSKLFSLGDYHGQSLQTKLDIMRSSADLLNQLKEKLGSKPEVLSQIDSELAESYINRSSKENSPKSKLSAIIKTLHYIGETSPTSSADDSLPSFVFILTESNVNDWWQNFSFIQRFRRSDAIVGQAEYCLTSFEAAIHSIEEFTSTDIPAEITDTAILSKPLKNPRAPTRYRSSSQSSRGSSNNSSTAAATASFSQRLGETLNSYKTMLVTSSGNTHHSYHHHNVSPRRSATNYASHPLIDQRFMTADADSSTIADVRSLLKEYKRLAEHVDGRRGTLS